MRKILACLVLFGFAAGASADVGWNNSYAYVWPGADPEVWYDLNGTDQGANFHGADLGTFAITGSLFLNGQMNAWADGADYYVADSFALYYRVYATGDTPGGWNHSQSVSISNEGGNNWRGTPPGVNILQGLTPGDYSVDVFAYKIHYFDSGNQSWEERIWRDGVDNQPYTAEFTVNPVPEPATMSLLGLGALALMLRRKMSK